jgi:hypothetical protein
LLDATRANQPINVIEPDHRALERGILGVQVSECSFIVGDGYWPGGELLSDDPSGHLSLSHHGGADQQDRAPSAEMGEDRDFFFPVDVGNGQDRLVDSRL